MGPPHDTSELLPVGALNPRRIEGRDDSLSRPGKQVQLRESLPNPLVHFLGTGRPMRASNSFMSSQTYTLALGTRSK